jgi:hypothetical protein
MKKLLLFICSILFSISLLSQVSIISQTNVSCPGMCNGAVTLSVTGGIMPYSVSSIIGPSTSCLLPPYPPVNSNTITITGLCACSYSLQVKDASATTIGTVVVTITAPPAIVISFSVQNVCCNGQCNGSVTPFVSGGTAPYMNNWFPNNPTAGACAGTYDLCVTDFNGCVKCNTVTISQPAPFVVTSSVSATSCSSCCDGAVYAFGSGGVPGYTYTIFPGGTTNSTGTFTNLCTGSYSICANDAGCCFTCIGVTVPTGSVTSIHNSSPQSVSINVVPNPSDGHIKLLTSQNLPALNYEIFDIIGNKIDFGKVTDNININPSPEGVYFLFVRNAEGEIVAKRKINIKH